MDDSWRWRYYTGESVFHTYWVQQLRYLAIRPKKTDVIREIELVKGPDDTAPVVMAVTVETP